MEQTAIARRDNQGTPLSIESAANAVANDIQALCEGMNMAQMRYLARLVVASSITEAATAAGVKPSTVRAWRCQHPGFREAEAVARRAGGSLAKRIALEMANAFTGQAISRLVHEMDHAEHSRDRLRAGELLLKVGGLLRESPAHASPGPNVAVFLGTPPPRCSCPAACAAHGPQPGVLTLQGTARQG